VTVRAQVIGPRYPHATDNGEHWLGAQFLVLGGVTARTRQMAQLWGGRSVFQQFTQGGCSGLMQGGPQGGFHGLQIRSTAFVTLGEDATQQLVYFARDLLMDCSSRFFYSSVQPPRCCSTGRSAQIFSLIRTKSSLSFWS